MERVNAEDLGIIEPASLFEDLKEREAGEIIRNAIAHELAKQLHTFVAAERNVMRFVQGEVTWLSN
jgi:hypothetical protein